MKNFILYAYLYIFFLHKKIDTNVAFWKISLPKIFKRQNIIQKNLDTHPCQAESLLQET